MPHWQHEQMDTLMNKFAVFFSLFLFSAIGFASSLNDFTPIKITENLNGLHLTIESKMVQRISVVKLTNKENIPVFCAVTFKDGPSPASVRRTTLSAGGSKLLSKGFGRNLNALRLNVDCQKKVAKA